MILKWLRAYTMYRLHVWELTRGQILIQNLACQQKRIDMVQYDTYQKYQIGLRFKILFSMMPSSQVESIYIMHQMHVWYENYVRNQSISCIKGMFGMKIMLGIIVCISFFAKIVCINRNRRCCNGIVFQFITWLLVVKLE